MIKVPKLSVIIPVYNVEKYLAATLDSVVNQTLRDIEIICVNDGSTDNSLQILQDYAARDSRIVVVNQVNSGQSVARNVGIALAKSNMIAFMDSDDILDLKAYKTALSKMTDDIDFVVFGIQTVGGKNPEIQKSDDEYYRIKYSGKTKITTDVINNTDVSPCNKIFRKSILKKHNLTFPEGLKFEDAYFFFCYGLLSNYGYYITDNFYKYIRHEDSTMGQTFSNKVGVSIDHLKIAIKFYEYLVQHKMYNRYELFFWKTFLVYLDLAVRYEHDLSARNEIYKLASDFVAMHPVSVKLDFWAERKLKMIKNQTFEKTKYLFLGLIKITETYNKKKYRFIGLPVYKIKFFSGYSKHYICGIQYRIKKC